MYLKAFVTMFILILTLSLALGGLTAIYAGKPWLIALVVAAPPGIWFLLRRPASLLGGMLVLGAWATVFGPGSLLLTPYKFVIVSLVALAVWRVARGYPDRPPPLWLSGTAVVMLMMFTMSEILCDAPRFTELTNLLSVVIITYMMWQLITSVAAVRSFIAMLALGQLVMALWVLREVPWSSLISQINVRARGLSGEPNVSGAVAVTWFFLALPLAFDRQAPRWQRLAAWIAVPAYLVALFGTASRGVTVATVVGLVMLAATQISSFGTALRAGGFVVLLSALAVTVAPKSYRERMTDTVQFDETTGQAVKVKDSQRRDLAMTSLEFIAEKPLFGGGSYGSAAARAKRGGRATTTHSTLLALTDSYGIPALILMLFLMARAGLAVIRLLRCGDPVMELYGAGWLAGYTALVVFSLTASTVVDRNIWLMIGLLCVAEGRLLGPPRGARKHPPRATPRAPPSGVSYAPPAASP